MRLVNERRLAKKESFGTPANNQCTANAKCEKWIGKLAIGNALDEQLDLILEWRRADRIGPLDHLAVEREAERHVLTGAVRQFRVGANPNDPEIRCGVAPGHDRG